MIEFINTEEKCFSMLNDIIGVYQYSLAKSQLIVLNINQEWNFGEGYSVKDATNNLPEM